MSKKNHRFTGQALKIVKNGIKITKRCYG